MVLIKKKIWPEYFEAVASGKKKFELRLNDFEVNEGDRLILEEWDPKIEQYTDKLFWPESEIRENGLQIILLE